MHRTLFLRYVLVLLSMMVVILLLPLPIDYTKAFIRAGSSTSAKTIIFGSSVIDMTSKCDLDQRSIAQMLAQKADRSVVDASRNGITVEGEVNVAAVVGKFRKLDTVIIAAGWRDILESDAISLHDAIAFKELNPELALDSLPAYYHGINSLFSDSEKLSRSFVYKGVTYLGGVNGLFDTEAAARSCPENDGHDQEGIAATYFHNVVEYSPDPSIARLLVSFNRDQMARQRSFVFLILPMNFERLGQLNAAWPSLVKQRVRAFDSELRAGGIRVLDLSETLSNNAFIDRWCGCPHLSDTGRLFVADRLTAFLATMTVAAGPDYSADGGGHGTSR